MSRLVHTGSVIVDLVMHIDRLPEPGGDTVASRAYATAGGAMNSLLAAARDGMDVLYCGLVGTGINADVISRALADAGISQAFAPVADEDNGYCVALVDDNAERTFITVIGAEGRFAGEHLTAIGVQPGDYVYVSGYSLATPENAQGLAQWLPSLDFSVTVFVDPSPLVTELPMEAFAPLLARCDILSTNKREAAVLTGLNENADPAELSRHLAAKVREGAWAIVRNGEEPTQACCNDGGGRVSSVPTFPREPVDTNGCGDVHAGVLLASLSKGMNIIDAISRANAAAALKATRTGPDSAPTTVETDEFLRSFGYAIGS